MSGYFTILKSTDGLYKEKGSKFISYAFHVESEAEINGHIEAIKKKYFDARHHCYAWVLGLDQQNYRANDDGEPSHSAGDPILGQIRSFNFTNILVVVVRYFGGTKLGVGGLITAYKTAASEALSVAEMVPIYEKCGISFEFDYTQMSLIERLISELAIEVNERIFQDRCKITGSIRKEAINLLEEKTKDLYLIKITLDP